MLNEENLPELLRIALQQRREEEEREDSPGVLFPSNPVCMSCACLWRSFVKPVRKDLKGAGWEFSLCLVTMLHDCHCHQRH